MAISTAELLKDIQLSIDINEFAQKNQDEFLSLPPHEYLSRMLHEKGLELSTVCAMADLDASYCYRIFSGARTPARNSLLHLTFAMGFSIDETQYALRLFRLARLDPRCYRDAAILFCISKGYTYEQASSLLVELGETEL